MRWMLRNDQLSAPSNARPEANSEGEGNRVWSSHGITTDARRLGTASFWAPRRLCHSNKLSCARARAFTGPWINEMGTEQWVMSAKIYDPAFPDHDVVDGSSTLKRSTAADTAPMPAARRAADGRPRSTRLRPETRCGTRSLRNSPRCAGADRPRQRPELSRSAQHEDGKVPPRDRGDGQVQTREGRGNHRGLGKIPTFRRSPTC